MSMGESAYDRINDYGAVEIGLASPYDVRSWSFGGVKSRGRSTTGRTGPRRTIFLRADLRS